MKMADFKTNDKERGIGLVGILVGLGIISIVAFAVMTFYSNSLKVTSAVDEQQAAEGLRQYVRAGLNCPSTMTAVAPTCRNAYVALAKAPTSAGARRLLVAGPGASPTVVGNYRLRAKCKNAAGEFDVEYAPKTGKGEWKGLFKIPLKCAP